MVRRRPHPPAFTAAILAALWTLDAGPSAAQPAAARPVSIVVARAEQREVAAAQPFVGTVVPVRVSDVGSAVEIGRAHV